MNILPLSKLAITKENVSEFTFLFDGEKDKSNSLNFTLNKDTKVVFVNLRKNFDLNVDIKNNSNVTLSFFTNNEISSSNININIDEGSTLTTYFADFANSDFKLVANVNLNGEGANCVWNLASLSKNVERKNIDVSVIHNHSNTYSKINNFGVSKDESRLVFSGICHIKNGSHNSKAHQNAKIMVFDEKCDSIAKPILKIDDNSIEASHAAVVGKISDDQLFYLTSRGLSMPQARELITFGYLKPIMAGFEDEEIKNTILHRIEEAF